MITILSDAVTLDIMLAGSGSARIYVYLVSPSDDTLGHPFCFRIYYFALPFLLKARMKNRPSLYPSENNGSYHARHEPHSIGTSGIDVFLPSKYVFIG